MINILGDCMKYFNLVILFVSLSCLSACNTMEGLGKDIKRGGAALENSAAKSNDETTAIKGNTTSSSVPGTVQKTN